MNNPATNRGNAPLPINPSSRGDNQGPAGPARDRGDAKRNVTSSNPYSIDPRTGPPLPGARAFTHGG